VDNLEIWFVPLMNPDGTYKGGNNTVWDSQRYNVANRWDLNRNSPCPCLQGNHEYYGLYNSSANETKAILDLGERYKFNINNNYHGGAEVVVWAYAAVNRRACDESWLIWGSTQFVDQVHDDCNNNGYMTSCGGDGLSRGIDWYECHGVILDYFTYFNHSKGYTKELSMTKKLPENQINRHWDYLREAFFQAYEQVFEVGIHGVVTDSITGDSLLNVKATALNHDFDNAEVYTDSAGFYCRYINTGRYSIKFSLDGYRDKTIDVTLDSYNDKIVLDVQLVPNNVAINNSITMDHKRYFSILPENKGIRILYNNREKAPVQVGIYNIKGKLVKEYSNLDNSITWNGQDNEGQIVSNGCYLVTIKINGTRLTERFVFNK
jgi:hypothetical protein